MAGNPPVVIGSGTALASSLVITLTGNVAIGDAIIICFGLRTGGSLSSVVDSGGNVYANDAGTIGGGDTAYQYYCLTATVALTSGVSTVTITASIASGVTAVVSKVVGGLLAHDQTAASTGGASSAFTVGPTGATSAAVELVIATCAAFLNAATTFTAGGAYTALTSASNATDGCYPEYVVTAATGAQTATGTLSLAPVGYSGVISTFTYPAAAGTSRLPSVPTLPTMPSIS